AEWPFHRLPDSGPAFQRSGATVSTDWPEDSDRRGRLSRVVFEREVAHLQAAHDGRILHHRRNNIHRVHVHDAATTEQELCGTHAERESEELRHSAGRPNPWRRDDCRRPVEAGHAGDTGRVELARGAESSRAGEVVMALDAGTRVGPYEVLAKLGE